MKLIKADSLDCAIWKINAPENFYVFKFLQDSRENSKKIQLL